MPMLFAINFQSSQNESRNHEKYTRLRIKPNISQTWITTEITSVYTPTILNSL